MDVYILQCQDYLPGRIHEEEKVRALGVAEKPPWPSTQREEVLWERTSIYHPSWLIEGYSHPLEGRKIALKNRQSSSWRWCWLKVGGADGLGYEVRRKLWR
jgi:hypothetical protein